jgi:L-lysine exporter family protein LysE/ArgO
MDGLISPALAGFGLGLGLIIAIGAQNAFILRQGLMRRHVFVLCLVCALADAALIAVGVAGFGTLVASSPVLIAIATLGGAVFLVVYGIVAFRRALHPAALKAAGGEDGSLSAALFTCLAFTFLNPHVYLDTVVLVGSLSAQYAGAARASVGLGAVVASFVWFFALGYGARLLAPVFARPLAWRVLDTMIGLLMLALAASLVMRYLAVS